MSDLDEIPAEYRNKVKFYGVSHLKEVLRTALIPVKLEWERRPKI
jgi:ATP-dependent Lon protease